METTTRTVLGNLSQTAIYLGIHPEIYPNSTFNQHLEINDDVEPSPDDRFSLNYIVIGSGGHKFTAGVGMVPRISNYRHKSTDTNLFKTCPLVLRPLGSDLGEAEIAQYCLRKQVEINGEVYWGYYGLRIDKSQTSIIANYHTVVNGETTTRIWTPTDDDANPVPEESQQGGNLIINGDRVSTLSEFPLRFTAGQIREFSDACRIINGQDGYNFVSEVAFCTGFDRTINVQTENGTRAMKEAMCVQVASFMATRLDFDIATESAGSMIEVGTSDPVYELIQG